MKFEKQKLSDAKQVYFITKLDILGKERVIAAPEGPGSTMVFTPPTFEPITLATGPGGCMGFAGLPGRDDALLMITAFYPIFQSEKAGIDLFQAVDGLNQPWSGRRIIDLPFVHRICMMSCDTRHFLVAAAVCGGKDFQDDWSRPDKVYVAQVPDQLDGSWELTPVMEGIHKNHGMKVGTHGGKQCVFIAGTEGVFALFPPQPDSDEWTNTPLLSHEISEVYPADLDGDGEDELAVIEPFHGNQLSVYKCIDQTWTKVFSAELAFGHGLWAGALGGEKVVITGNRRGTENLVCFRTVGTDPFDMEEIVIDARSGTTNMDVLRTEDADILVAANATHAEYARYTVVS
jgi:hypothetical protein